MSIIHATDAEFAATVYHLEFESAVIIQSRVRGCIARARCVDRVLRALREQALQTATRALREPIYEPTDEEQVDFDLWAAHNADLGADSDGNGTTV